MQARALETRRAIVQAAAEAFVQHGFNGASLAQIASEAGVTKGALYFHFPSKAALAEAMILTQEEANAQFAEEVRGHTGDHLDLLVAMTHGLAQRLIDDPTVRAAMRLAVERGETENNSISETYATWELLVTEVTRAGQDRGEIAGEVDPAQLARFLVSAFTGMQTVSLVASGLGDLHGRIDEMWRLLRPGLTPG